MDQEGFARVLIGVAFALLVGITFDEFHGVPPDVREALERDKPVVAMQRFRASTGAGLKAAKDYVDEIRRRLLR